MRRASRGGFTIVELILVIVLIGIISTVAVMRFTDTRHFSAIAFSQEVRSLVRFGQKLAIAQNRAIYLVTSPSRVALCYNPSCSQPVTSPVLGNSERQQTGLACANEAWLCEGVPNGISMGASPLSSMFFNALGRPFAGSDSPAGDISTFSTMTISIGGGETAQVITIERETGYVH